MHERHLHIYIQLHSIIDYLNYPTCRSDQLYMMLYVFVSLFFKFLIELCIKKEKKNIGLVGRRGMGQGRKYYFLEQIRMKGWIFWYTGDCWAFGVSLLLSAIIFASKVFACHTHWPVTMNLFDIQFVSP